MALEPTLQEVIADAIESRLLEVHTSIPGKVVSYDKKSQTAEVAPVVQRAEPRDDGSSALTPLPSIPNVPVSWHRGGGAGLTMPLKAGDHVLLVFSEAAFGHWRASGELAPPGDLRRHSLGYAYAVPGGGPESQALDDAAGDGEVVLTVGDNVFRVGGASADMVALAKLVQLALDKIQATFDAHTHMHPPGPSPPAPTSPPASPIGPLGPVAATKLKAE